MIEVGMKTIVIPATVPVGRTGVVDIRVSTDSRVSAVVNIDIHIPVSAADVDIVAASPGLSVFGFGARVYATPVCGLLAATIDGGSLGC
jgi:hypothetical protein